MKTYLLSGLLWLLILPRVFWYQGYQCSSSRYCYQVYPSSFVPIWMFSGHFLSYSSLRILLSIYLFCFSSFCNIFFPLSFLLDLPGPPATFHLLILPSLWALLGEVVSSPSTAHSSTLKTDTADSSKLCCLSTVS